MSSKPWNNARFIYTNMGIDLSTERKKDSSLLEAAGNDENSVAHTDFGHAARTAGAKGN